jgi:hypothetical protein
MTFKIPTWVLLLVLMIFPFFAAWLSEWWTDDGVRSQYPSPPLLGIFVFALSAGVCWTSLVWMIWEAK